MHVSMVPRDHIESVWPKVEGYLTDAAEYSNGRFTVDDIYDSLTQYDNHLWIAFDEEGIKGAVTTRFVDYPRKRILAMDFTGGVELDSWKDLMLKMLQHWAYDNHCDGVEFAGRPGWVRKFKDSTGFSQVWQSYEFPAADAGLGADHG